MKQIEKALLEIHQSSAQKEPPKVSQNSRSQAPSAVQVLALVDAVTTGSPAEKGGLKVGDLITQFGTATPSNSASGVQAIQTVAVSSVGRYFDVFHSNVNNNNKRGHSGCVQTIRRKHRNPQYYTWSLEWPRNIRVSSSNF